MRRDVYPEPPSVVESDSGWKEIHPIVGDNIPGVKDEDFVVLSSIGSAHYSRSLPRNSVNVNSLERNFRFGSFTNFSAWFSNINEYLESRRQRINYLSEPSGPMLHGDPDDHADTVSVVSHRARPVSAQKILNIYIFMLKLLGLRNFGDPENCVYRVINILWMVFIFSIIIVGYALNITLCQKQQSYMEHGKIYRFCNDSQITYHYIEGICRTTMESLIPTLLHFVAYGYTFWIYRVKQSEHVEALLQKALVLPSSVTCTNTVSRKEAFKKRFKFVSYLIFTSIYLHFLFTIINSFFGKALLQSECIIRNNTTSLEHESFIFKNPYIEGVFYAIPAFTMYFFLCPILMTFILQTMLISYLLTELRETLREKRSSLKSMMQEAHDISTFLHRMNSESGPAMSFIIFYLVYGLFVDLFSVFLSIQSAKSFLSLFDANEGCPTGNSSMPGAHWTTWLEPEDTYTPDDARVCRYVKIYGAISMVVVVIRNAIVIMFVFLTITKGCKIATCHKRLMNQALETRVFGYTPNEGNDELDSFHYYIRALRMRAKIFQYPMETKKLLFPLVFLVMGALCLDVTGNLL